MGMRAGNDEIVDGTVRVKVIRQVFIAVFHRRPSGQEEGVGLDSFLLFVLPLDDTDDQHLAFLQSHHLGCRQQAATIDTLRLRL